MWCTQGSILGPFLFNANINDLVNIDNQVQFVIYADDTSMFFSAADADTLSCQANCTLTKFALWSDTNGPKVNTMKSKAILFR